MCMLQGSPKIVELLADPSAELTLLAPTNAGLPIEQLTDADTVRPPFRAAPLTARAPPCVDPDTESIKQHQY